MGRQAPRDEIVLADAAERKAMAGVQSRLITVLGAPNALRHPPALALAAMGTFCGLLIGLTGRAPEEQRPLIEQGHAALPAEHHGIYRCGAAPADEEVRTLAVVLTMAAQGVTRGQFALGQLQGMRVSSHSVLSAALFELGRIAAAVGASVDEAVSALAAPTEAK